MKIQSKLLVTLTTAGIMAAGLAQATIYDFSVGYTNGPLNGQNGFVAGVDNVIAGGELVMATTNEWETALTGAGLSATNTHFTISSWFSFDQTGARTSGQEVHRIMLNNTASGTSVISANLRRGNIGTDLYILQTKTDQAGSAANQGWQTFNSSQLGFAAGDAPGSSDELYMSITFEKGATADTWSSYVVLSNLTAGTEIKSENRIAIFDVTTDMHNAATYYGGLNGSQTDSTVGVANRIVTKLEVAAEYITPPTYDTVFDYNFDGIGDNSEFAATLSGWDHANQWGWGFIHTNENGARVVHRPASVDPDLDRNGWNWRGEIYTNGLRTVEVGESIEFAVDYTMFAHTAVANRNGIDFFFTTNGVSSAGASGAYIPSQQSFGTYPEGQLGFRVKQGSWNNGGNWPDGGFQINMDPANVSQSQGSVSLNNIGITNITGGAAADIESNPMTLTFTALKTENSGVWDLTVTIQNQSGGTLKSIDQPSWTNDALYNATDIYFGMYSANATVGEEGTELDNLHCRINYIDPSSLSTWEQFELAYGITTGLAGDQDMDGENNWYEYVLGGDPTNDAVQASQPSFDAGDYVFSIRGDSALSYSVLSKGDLVIGSWTTNGPIAVSANDGALHALSETVGTTAPKMFMKLIVE